MVAELLTVMERPACDAADGAGHACRDKAKPQGVVAQGGHKAKGAKRRNKRGGKHANAAQRDGQSKPAGKRAHESHHAQHDGRGRTAGVPGGLLRTGACAAGSVRACVGGAPGCGLAVIARSLGTLIICIRICRELLLAVPHACIDARVRQKLVMGAALGNATALQHQNLVGVHNR